MKFCRGACRREHFEIRRGHDHRGARSGVRRVAERRGPCDRRDVGGEA
jgi:hypothetical protein